MKTTMGKRMAMMAAMFGGIDTVGGEPYVEPKEYSEFKEGVRLSFAPNHQPIYMLNNSQKAKSKRLSASNKRQGRN